MPTPRAAPGPSSAANAAATALGFDVVEWFHDPTLAAQLSHRHWRRLPTRAAVGVDRALIMCAEHGSQATFFVLGAIAEAEPDLMRRIVAAGHEIASLGWLPRDLDAVAPGEREVVLLEWERARQALEGITGVAVRGFRAAWNANGEVAWWRDALLAKGYAYDGSRAHAEFVATWQLDTEQPRLVGLPARTLREHYEPLARVPAALEQRLRAKPCQSIAASLGLAACPAPPRVPLHVVEPARPARAARVGLPRLAVVVPLMNEEAGLPSLAVDLDALTERLRDLAAWEFVFVDDGSTDRTWSLLQSLFGARANVQLVQHARNLGVSAAIRTGMLATDAPFVASIDGDLSYDPLELEHMLPLLEGADVVTASPYHRAGGVKNVPAWRLSLSRTLSWCYQRLLRSEVSTWTSCFRVYRRAAVAELPQQNQGFLGTAELLVRVLRRGGVVREHPCVLEARLFGLSKMKILRTIRGHLRLLWQVARGGVR
jgi:hypothetical protein